MHEIAGESKLQQQQQKKLWQQRQTSSSTYRRYENILHLYPSLYVSISISTKIIKISLLNKNLYSFHLLYMEM